MPPKYDKPGSSKEQLRVREIVAAPYRDHGVEEEPPTPYDLPVRDETPRSRPPPSRSRVRISLPPISNPVGKVKDLLYLVGLIYAAFEWYQNLATKKNVEDARVQCVASAASALASAMAPTQARLDTLEKHGKKEDMRWDALDKDHERQRKPNQPAPPKFGPTAEKHGEVKFDVEPTD